MFGSPTGAPTRVLPDQRRGLPPRQVSAALVVSAGCVAYSDVAGWASPRVRPRTAQDHCQGDQHGDPALVAALFYVS
ncbi:hypothetical protein QJS66_12095 [Kocuria rhizophila]|nr:hypothetical protein QJS66_12095 [Kocuria rhizophila]